MYLTILTSSGFHISVHDSKVKLCHPDVISNITFKPGILYFNIQQLVMIRQATREEKESAIIQGWGEQEKG